MIQDTIARLEENVENSATLKPENKTELLRLLATLRGEVGELAKTHADDARSIAGFAAVSTHEATRTEPNPELLELSLQGLSRSVGEFEGTHPRLVQIVNSICTAMSNLGI
jgi:hypothetical protein